MSGYKFVHREQELKIAKDALIGSNFVVLHYFDNSGLTHYLRKLQRDLSDDGNVCFYVDCGYPQGLAVQVAEQILYGHSQSDLDNFTDKAKNAKVFKRIVKSFVTSANFVPGINIGTLAKNLMESIDSTIDVDIDHASDYKIEKAIVDLMRNLEGAHDKGHIFLLLDNATSLSPASLGFVSTLMSRSSTKIFFASPVLDETAKLEALSKLSNTRLSPFEINELFKRPDEGLIKGLFKCYEKEYKDEYMDIFDKHERNIHVIMSVISGFSVYSQNFNECDLCIIKILTILDAKIKSSILETIFSRIRTITKSNEHISFSSIIGRLEKLSCIFVDGGSNISISKKIFAFTKVNISLVDKIKITRDIIDIFEYHKHELSIEQLKFAVANLDKSYTRRKEYALLLVSKQNASGHVEQHYLDMLFYLDTKKELLEVCSLYYNFHIYDVPALRLIQHPQYANDRAYKVLEALLNERKHEGDYSGNLSNLIEETSNMDEKCLLMSILFQAFHNAGKSDECIAIINDKSHPNYHQGFSQSKYYPFLLRNISYYTKDIRQGIENYKKCLSRFKNSDPVNYNRTMSNFICYLMRHDYSAKARMTLDRVMAEVESILDFNDTKYMYLNINYGIYLMKYDRGNPSKFFDAIIHESGTTRTPYIYAKVNNAMYVAKSDPMRALDLLDDIYYEAIIDSTVIPTKTFYQINRLFVEYMTGNFDKGLLNEVKRSPLRGDAEYTNSLFKSYSKRFRNNIPYKKRDWSELFLPGYIFYHGFDINLLWPIIEISRETAS